MEHGVGTMERVRVGTRDGRLGRLELVWLVVAMLVLSALPSSGWAADVEAARAEVREGIDAVLARIEEERDRLAENPDRLYEILVETVYDDFDFEAMARLAVGAPWRDASPAERERFVTEFSILIMRSYAEPLRDYRDQRVDVLEVRRGDDQGRRVVVRTVIHRPGKPSVPVNYQLRLTDGEWKVFDIVIEGVSLVINYRKSFNSQVRSIGVDGMIERLAERNREALGEGYRERFDELAAVVGDVAGTV